MPDPFQGIFILFTITIGKTVHAKFFQEQFIIMRISGKGFFIFVALCIKFNRTALHDFFSIADYFGEIEALIHQLAR